MTILKCKKVQLKSIEVELLTERYVGKSNKYVMQKEKLKQETIT